MVSGFAAAAAAAVQCAQAAVFVCYRSQPYEVSTLLRGSRRQNAFETLSVGVPVTSQPQVHRGIFNYSTRMQIILWEVYVWVIGLKRLLAHVLFLILILSSVYSLLKIAGPISNLNRDKNQDQ